MPIAETHFYYIASNENNPIYFISKLTFDHKPNVTPLSIMIFRTDSQIHGT